MSALIVDTSVWISYFRGDELEEVDQALQESRLYLPPIVVAELLSARLERQKAAQLSDFLSELPLCHSDYEHWRRAGRLRARLAESGLNVSTPDAHIAQCALDAKAMLLSRDRVFQKMAKFVDLRLA